jgi:hypothetical protein
MATLHLEDFSAMTTKKVKVETLAEASKKTLAFIEDRDLGSRDVGMCVVLREGKVIAHISYNGRVWEAGGLGLVEITGNKLQEKL